MALINFTTVVELGLAIPGVVSATAYGAPALKLNGKIVACIPTNKSAEPESLVVRVDPEHRAELLREMPEVYYVTDHYAPHPTVLVRLSKITRKDLKELLRDACRSNATSRSADRRLPRRPTRMRPKSDPQRRT